MLVIAIASLFAVEVQPTWNLVADIQQLLAYPFMQNAFLAGTLIASIAGAVGYFMVLRGQSFAGHTLANVGFAGASGAVLVGGSPMLGLLVFCIGAAIGIDWLSGQRSKASGGASGGQWGKDVAIGTIQTFALGLGLLFAQLSSSSNAAGVYSILFGSVLGISHQDVRLIGWTTLVTLAGLMAIARPLLFASVDPEVAEARGIPVQRLSKIFLVLLAIAVAQSVQVVGILLIFALLVTPAAIAQQLTARPAIAVVLSVLLALLFTWAGLAVAYFSPYPVGFFITSFAFGTYATVRLLRSVKTGLTRRFRNRSGGAIA